MLVCPKHLLNSAGDPVHVPSRAFQLLKIAGGSAVPVSSSDARGLRQGEIRAHPKVCRSAQAWSACYWARLLGKALVPASLRIVSQCCQQRC